MRLIQWIAAIAMLTGGLAFAAQAETGVKPDPYAKPDGTWISIGGTVENVTANAFTLDYGDGQVLVEMDDGDRDADGYKLIDGDKVTVNGRIDDDFFETTKIEASSVYVEKLGTFFYASPRDEEDVFLYSTVTPIVVASTTLQGIVTEVRKHEFVVDTGPRSTVVEVDQMPYDPLDDEGYLRVRVGDFVRVSGQIDENLFQGRTLEARSLVKLSS